MANYDLTRRIAPHLDVHLLFPLFEFLQERQLYHDDDILEAKIQLLKKTNMVDYAMDIHKSLYPTKEVPQDMIDKRVKVVGRLKSLEEAAAPLISFLQNPNSFQELRLDKQYNLQILNGGYQIGPEQIEALYHYAKIQFECGDYSGAADCFYQYSALCTNSDRSLSALWGKLAAELLMQNWDIALEELNRLKKIIDSKNFTSPLNQLQSRIRLMHWSLFIFFNHDNGRTQIIDLFNLDKYLTAIQTNAPHLLRYLATAFIVNKKRRSQFKDFIKVIQQEQYSYKDPITEFLACVYVNYDFEGALKKMRECEDVILNDPFLGKRVKEGDFSIVPLRDEFLENARLFIFETYCRIHQCIDIRMLAEKLNLNHDEVEGWIGNFVRNAKLDVKIDSKSGSVVMEPNHLNVYEKLIEHTVDGGGLLESLLLIWPKSTELDRTSSLNLQQWRSREQQKEIKDETIEEATPTTTTTVETNEEAKPTVASAFVNQPNVPETTSGLANSTAAEVDESTPSTPNNVPISTAEGIIEDTIQEAPAVEVRPSEEISVQEKEIEHGVNKLVVEHSPTSTRTLQEVLDSISALIAVEEQEEAPSPAQEDNEVRVESHPDVEEVLPPVQGEEEGREEAPKAMAEEERVSDPTADSPVILPSASTQILPSNHSLLLESEITELVAKYPISEDHKATWEAILRRHGDIVSSCNIKNSQLRAALITVVCQVIRMMKETNTNTLDDTLIVRWEEDILDVEQFNMRVDWLKEYFKNLKTTLKLSEEFKSAKKQHDERLARVNKLEAHAQETLNIIARFKAQLEEAEEELFKTQKDYKEIKDQMKADHFNYSLLKGLDHAVALYKEQGLAFDLL